MVDVDGRLITLGLGHAMMIAPTMYLFYTHYLSPARAKEKTCLAFSPSRVPEQVSQPSTANSHIFPLLLGRPRFPLLGATSIIHSTIT